MERQIISILSFLFLIGCSNVDYKPKYKDFENSWERENLIGKIKTLEQYKANVIDFETGETEKPIIEFKKVFTEAGNISYQEHFDNFGNLEQYVKNEFDNKGYRIKSLSENFNMNSKSIETAKFDTVIKKQVSAHVIFNDTIDFTAFFKYEKNGNLAEQKSIQNRDTTSNQFVYKYNDKEEILLKKQIQNSEYGVNEYLNEFKYDQNGNLIELSNKSDFGESKSIYKYDGENRIKKLTEYSSGQIEKETVFDRFYNQTLVCFFVSNALHKEMRYKYKFDNTGNWIKRDVFMKEHFGDKKTLPIYTETREIKYYE